MIGWLCTILKKSNFAIFIQYVIFFSNSPKNIRHYCHSELYDQDHLDTLGKLDVDAFYRRPGKDKRFFVQPVGVNELGTIMKKCVYWYRFWRILHQSFWQENMRNQLISGRSPRTRNTGPNVQSVRKYKNPQQTCWKTLWNRMREAVKTVSWDEIKPERNQSR